MANVSVLNTSASLSGKTLLKAEDNQNVPGLKTFNRGTNPPFACSAGAAMVPYLDADKLDGYEATDFYLKSAYNSLKYFNVVDYGAEGDGSTNDAQAFIDALAAVVTAGGGTIYVPPGTYALDFSVLSATYGLRLLTTGIEIRGAGRGQSILKNTSASTPMLTLSGLFQGVRDLKFDGNGSSGYCLKATAESPVIENLLVINQDGTSGSVIIDGATYARLMDVEISGCESGFSLGPTAANTFYVTMTACKVSATTGAHIAIKQCAALNVFGFNSDNSDAVTMTSPITIDASSGIYFNGLTAEWNDPHVLSSDMYMQINDSTNVVINGGRFNQEGDDTKTFIKLTGSSEQFEMRGFRFITTEASMVCIEAGINLNGLVLSGISTVFTAAGVGVKLTAATTGIDVSNWIDRSAALTHTIDGAMAVLRNIAGNIAITTRDDQTLINCTGTISGTGATEALRLQSSGGSPYRVGNGSSPLFPEYADNAAALAGGLVAGESYHTATGVMMVVV